MGIAVTRSFATPVAYLKSSEQVGFEASLVGSYRHPCQVWRATDMASGTSYVGLDFGAATSLAGVFVDCVNASSVKIQHSSNASTWSDDATVTTAVCKESNRRKFYQSLTSWNYRYLRLLANTSTATDGSGVFSAGVVIGVTSWDRTWATNPADPLGRDIVTTKSRGTGAVRDQVRLADQYASISLASSQMDDTMDDTILELGAYGADPFLLYLNQGAAEDSYLVQIVGDSVGLKHTEATIISMNGVLLEELT